MVYLLDMDLLELAFLMVFHLFQYLQLDLINILHINGMVLLGHLLSKVMQEHLLNIMETYTTNLEKTVSLVIMELQF